METVKGWSERRDIQVFLGFANFYRRFIKNFSRIAAQFLLMLCTTNESTSNEPKSSQAKSQDATGRPVSGEIDNRTENLSSGTMAKRSSKAEFPSCKAKKAFSRLWKAFTKALILRHFDPEYHIWIETDILRYAINKVLSQMTLDQYFSNHVTHQANGQTNLLSEIGQ